MDQGVVEFRIPLVVEDDPERDEEAYRCDESDQPEVGISRLPRRTLGRQTGSRQHVDSDPSKGRDEREQSEPNVREPSEVLVNLRVFLFQWRGLCVWGSRAGSLLDVDHCCCPPSLFRNYERILAVSGVWLAYSHTYHTARM